MELVMRIRRYAAENDVSLRIVYAKDAECYTELPWNENDLRKQRIRWTVGLSEVLWKYCEMSAVIRYSSLEKLTFWYYVLFEKFSPHIEFASLIVWIVLGIIDGISQTAIALMATTIILQFLLAIAGSFRSIKDSVESSENKCRALLKLLLLLVTFVTVYHSWHSFYRLIAVSSFRRKIHKTSNQGALWDSPTRR